MKKRYLIVIALLLLLSLLTSCGKSKNPLIGTWTGSHGSLEIKDDGTGMLFKEDIKWKVNDNIDDVLDIIINDKEENYEYKIENDMLNLVQVWIFKNYNREYTAVEEKEKDDNSIVGTWSYGSDVTYFIEFNEDGTGKEYDTEDTDIREIEWEVNDGTLTIFRWNNDNFSKYDYAIKDNTLSFTNERHGILPYNGYSFERF